MVLQKILPLPLKFHCKMEPWKMNTTLKFSLGKFQKSIKQKVIQIECISLSLGMGPIFPVSTFMNDNLLWICIKKVISSLLQWELSP